MRRRHADRPLQWDIQVKDDIDKTEPVNALDPFGVQELFGRVQRAWLGYPVELAAAGVRLALDAQRVNSYVAGRLLGMPANDPVSVNPEDERFLDPAWRELPGFDALKEHYLLISKWLNDLVYATPGLPEADRADAAFWLRQWLNTQAPSNYFFTNPVAMRRCLESSGESVAAGFRNFQRDAAAGDVQMVDPDAFEIGTDLALTPGVVVMREPLLELIHYTPVCERVHKKPIVIVTPWINKFYILDLNPRKSLVGWLLSQGFDVYVTSWKNVGADMAEIGFEDYILDGALTAVQTACEVSGVEQVHLVGYCLGGTGVAALMAWLAREYPEPADSPVAHWTLFAALTDFSKPGDIEVFLGEKGIAAVERIMERQGYLDGRDMARTFRMLRPNSLIWHYFVHSYLYGEDLPAFDVLFWNADSTRMPRAMHSWYLRELYLANKLAEPDAIELRGHTLDLGRIGQPLYAVGTREDHIAPWRQTFRSTMLTGGDSRYVLSSSGHILGIVNPPVDPPKRKYRAGDVLRGEKPAEWHKRMEWQPGSWWTDWAQWLGERCGGLREAPPVAGEMHPALGDAPGRYVLER